MKNGIRPLYTAPPIATNGSAKKRAFSLRKEILQISKILALMALTFALIGFGLNQWQKLHLERWIARIPWMQIGENAAGAIGILVFLALLVCMVWGGQRLNRRFWLWTRL